VTYLNELLAGYRKGLASNPAEPIQALRAALADTDDPWQRGALLGLLATALTARTDNRSIKTETTSRP
jgi:hypothetical protein